MDLTEAENIKRRWQEYTEELYKKELHNQDNHDGMITHYQRNANQNHNDEPFHASQNGCYPKVYKQ